MATTTVIDLMVCKKQLDALYHAFDLFESFKRLNENLTIEYEFEKSIPDLAFISRLKEQFEKNGYLVTAIWFQANPQINYVDWSVKVVSSGKQFCLLEDYLKQFGINKPSEVKQNEKS
jgi:hypothetical protein